MFFSNSFIIIKVIDIDLNILKDCYLFEDNSKFTNTRKFYSINFYDEKKDFGEIHYSQSYEHGNINVINFIRKGSIFFLFTSNLQHIKFFKKAIISMQLKKDLSFEIIKMPLDINVSTYKTENFIVNDSDLVYGIKGLLSFNSINHLIKIYGNGVVTFPNTNNKELVEEVMITSLNLILNHDK